MTNEPKVDQTYTDPNDPNLYAHLKPATVLPPAQTQRSPESASMSEEESGLVVGGVRGWRSVLALVRHGVWRGWLWLGDVAWRVVGWLVRWPWLGLILLALVWLGGSGVRWLAVLGVIGLAAAGGAPFGATLRVRSVSVQRAVRFRKRSRLVRSRWVAAMTNAAMTRPGRDGDKQKIMPKILGMREHPNGVSVTVDASPVGKGVHDFTTNSTTLCNSIGALSLRAVPVEQRRRGRTIRVDFRWTEPFPETIRIKDLPPARRRLHVTVGLDEDGRPLERNPFLPNLIIGAQGAGKSTEVWSTLLALKRAGIPVRLRIFDPKGGTEMGMLEEGCWDYASNPAHWPQFLGRACGALQVRQSILKQRGDRTAPLNDEFPLDLMVIDELVTVLAMSRGTMRVFGMTVAVRDAFAVLLSQQRAAGGSTWALSQLGEKDVIGPARGLFTYITCLRVNPTEKALVDILLGSGAHNAYPAHLLRPGAETAGIGWTTTEKEGVIRYRAAEPTEAERQEVLDWLKASVHNQRKVALPDPPAESAAPSRKPAGAGRGRRRPAGQQTLQEATDGE